MCLEIITCEARWCKYGIVLISFLTVEELCQDNRTIDYLTVTSENEAEVDLVWIQPFLLDHVNYAVLPTGIF